MLSLGRPGAGGQREQQAASPAPGVVSPAPPRLLLVFGLKLSAVVDFAVNIFKTFFVMEKLTKQNIVTNPQLPVAQLQQAPPEFGLYFCFEIFVGF